MTPDTDDLPIHTIPPDVPVGSKVDPGAANRAKAKAKAKAKGGMPWWGWLAIGYVVLKGRR